MYKKIFVVTYSDSNNYFLNGANAVAYKHLKKAYSIFTVESTLPLKTCTSEEYKLKADNSINSKILNQWAFLKLRSNFPSEIITRYNIAAWLTGEWQVEEVWGNPPVSREEQIDALTLDQKIEILKEATSFINKGKRDSVEEIEEITKLLYDKLLNIVL